MTDDERAEWDRIVSAPIVTARDALEAAAKICDLSYERWTPGGGSEDYLDGYATAVCDATTWLAEDMRRLIANIAQPIDKP